jgi:hypothetical protein
MVNNIEICSKFSIVLQVLGRPERLSSSTYTPLLKPETKFHIDTEPDKIIVLYTLIFMLLNSRLNGSKHYPNPISS